MEDEIVGRVTALLRKCWTDVKLQEELCRQVIGELCEVATARMHGQHATRTLEPNALVNEAWIRLTRWGANVHWKNRGHFVAVASRVMRQVLSDYARRKLTDKRGAGTPHVSLCDHHAVTFDRAEQELTIADLIDKLAENHPVEAKVLELKYYGGGSQKEIARYLEQSEGITITESRVKKSLQFARAWICRAMRPS